MFRQLYEKHPKLISLGFILCLIVLVYGGLCVVDTIQRETRPEPEFSLDLERKEEIKSYDVNGLTEEEIDMLLERGRQ